MQVKNPDPVTILSYKLSAESRLIENSIVHVSRVLAYIIIIHNTLDSPQTSTLGIHFTMNYKAIWRVFSEVVSTGDDKIYWNIFPTLRKYYALTWARLSRKVQFLTEDTANALDFGQGK